ncbi:hypothetical protein HJB66_31335 [Rhizobium lentis]|uniref:hypothetical protein n=1 Tax=Rhizobium lentis TaxID=1138194 RepID=UPI001C836FBB|nr:hypothetical protein [Rhizobium lentis]MBX5044982.1 hypothetical protein [Rhizobium lentis]
MLRAGLHVGAVGIDAAQFERALVSKKNATASVPPVRKFFTVEREGFKEAQAF